MSNKGGLSFRALSPPILGVMLGSDGLNHFWAGAQLRNKRGYVYPYGRRRPGQAWSAGVGELEDLESQGKNSTVGGDWSDFYKKAKGITGDQ